MNLGTGEDEGVRPTGKFRVYLGAAAGVGKTCAMLDEGWRRFQRGADVVVGFVETHKRPYTVEQIRDLPVVPRKKVRYRDIVQHQGQRAATCREINAAWPRGKPAG